MQADSQRLLERRGGKPMAEHSQLHHLSIRIRETGGSKNLRPALCAESLGAFLTRVILVLQREGVAE